LTTTNADAFSFLDTDNDETIDRQEFYACYDNFGDGWPEELSEIYPREGPVMELRAPPSTDAAVWVCVALVMVGAAFLTVLLGLHVLKSRRQSARTPSMEQERLVE